MHGGDIYNNSVDIDFSVNLNPYADSRDEDRAYPDIEQTRLRKALSEFEGVGYENVFAGCGASQLLMAVALAVRPKTALLIEPCFSGYAHVLAACPGCSVRRVFLKEEGSFALTGDILDSLTDDVDLLFLADPGNPTGRNIAPDLLIRILDRAKDHGISVVLDDSFYTLSEWYVQDGRAGLVERYPGLYIIRSFTKSFALPGIRMGYVMSSAENIKRIRMYLPEWNLPALSEESMLSCIAGSKDGHFYEDSVRMIRKERQFLAEKLSELGFTVFDSDTVFLLIKGREGIYEELLKDGILIRKCDDFGGLDGRFYRIAVREREDNVRLIDALKKTVRS